MSAPLPAKPAAFAPAGRRPPVRLLVTFGIIGPLTIHLLLPSLPYLQRHFGTDYATVQLLISFYVVAFGVAQLFIGPLADLIGRRKTLIGGLALYTASSALCALAPSFEILMGLRVLQAVGACAGIVLARAIIRDHYDERQSTRMLGYLAMGVAVGPMLGPFAGGALFEITGWRGLFWVLAAVGGASAILAWVFIEETGQLRTGAGRVRLLFIEMGVLLRNPRFLLYALNICFHTGMFYAFLAGGPFLASEFFAMTPKAYGAWFATAAAGYAAGNFVAGRLVTRFRNENVVFTGGVIVFILNLFLVFILLTGLHSPFPIFGIVASATFASGLVMPNSYAGALSADAKLAGSASGFLGFLQFSFAAGFSTLASLAIEHWHHPVALGVVMAIAAALGFVASTMLLAMRRM